MLLKDSIGSVCKRYIIYCDIVSYFYIFFCRYIFIISNVYHMWVIRYQQNPDDLCYAKGTLWCRYLQLGFFLLCIYISKVCFLLYNIEIYLSCSENYSCMCCTYFAPQPSTCSFIMNCYQLYSVVYCFSSSLCSFIPKVHRRWCVHYASYCMYTCMPSCSYWGF